MTGKSGYRGRSSREYFEANTELMHLVFSRAESAVVPFEVREGKHTPGMDFTRCHQVLEEGDKFESSFLRMNRWCFLALGFLHTHLSFFCLFVCFALINSFPEFFKFFFFVMDLSLFFFPYFSC